MSGTALNELRGVAPGAGAPNSCRELRGVCGPPACSCCCSELRGVAVGLGGWSEVEEAAPSADEAAVAEGLTNTRHSGVIFASTVCSEGVDLW